jgi:hypothetical protein
LKRIADAPPATFVVVCGAHVSPSGNGFVGTSAVLADG